ncbi:MAG: sigma-70 family RNA polymerase sigma factor [Bryobacterales bacterium]|nr:sigma-70 family RNA polymerase sigma factor [Bryobacterales bacterium]
MPSANVTELLERWNAGDPEAPKLLAPIVYEELRRVARRFRHKGSRDVTLQNTALVHEAYLRLVDAERVQWHGRAHFFSAAANAMRQIVVDHVRAARASKRGGTRQRVPFEFLLDLAEDRHQELMAVHEALDRFAVLDPERAKLVELRYFGGLTLEEVADVTGASLATVKRHWTAARLWLHKELSQPGPAPSSIDGDF